MKMMMKVRNMLMIGLLNYNDGVHGESGAGDVDDDSGSGDSNG